MGVCRRVLAFVLMACLLVQPLALAAEAAVTINKNPRFYLSLEEAAAAEAAQAAQAHRQQELAVPEVPEEPETLPMPEATLFEQVPAYFQTDYPNVRYGDGSLAETGCGMACLAMVASYLTQHVYTPDMLAHWFGGDGSNNMERMEFGAKAMELPYEKNTNWHVTLEALKEGKIAIALMEEGSLFTTGQHFVVLRGITEDGRILVNDPNEDNYSHWRLKYGFEHGFQEWEIVQGISGSWVFDPEAMPEEPFLYMEEELDKSKSRYSGVELTMAEMTLMAEVVWVEAQGECFEGQQAVAEVILNRLVSEDFPNTVKSVIYSEGQFRSVEFLEDAAPSQTQYEAVEKALYGPNILPIDVVHFATFQTTKNVWGSIENHIFCYAE